MVMQDKSEVTSHEISRREFLRLAISSALLMGAATKLEGEQPSSFAELRELAPGAVQPEGWLRGMLTKQAAQLGSKLPEVSRPFNGTYWAGEEKDESIKPGQSWFAWEQKAYWIDGAARLAIVLEDEALMERVWATMSYTLSHADADGYLGPQLFKEPKGDNHRWPQAVFFRSLSACADASPTPTGVTGKDIAEAMRRHYLGDQASYATPERNVTNIESILWCYGRTGDARLLALAEDAWAGYSKVANDELHGDLSPVRVFGATPIDAHGVTYAETIKLPAILYLHTGKKEVGLRIQVQHFPR